MPRSLDTEIRFQEWQTELRGYGFEGDEPALPQLPEFVDPVDYAPTRIRVVTHVARPSRAYSLTIAVIAFVLFAALILCFWRAQ